jgi:uncharacterized protein
MYFSQYEQTGMHGRISEFMYRVYGWMMVGLMLTGAIAYYVSTVPAFYQALFSNTALLILLFVAQIVIALALSFFVMRLSFPVAVFLFLLYAAMLGISLSAIFLVYTATSIYATFFVAAAMFGIMCVYGYVTQTDLTSMGNVLLMALIGLVIGGIVNMFLKSPAFNYVLSGIGVILFTLLTAYDSQKIKQIAQQLMMDRATMNKIALLGALTLYLDFINLFLYLLQFMGQKRDE